MAATTYWTAVLVAVVMMRGCASQQFYTVPSVDATSCLRAYAGWNGQTDITTDGYLMVAGHMVPENVCSFFDMLWTTQPTTAGHSSGLATGYGCFDARGTMVAVLTTTLVEVIGLHCTPLVQEQPCYALQYVVSALNLQQLRVAPSYNYIILQPVLQGTPVNGRSISVVQVLNLEGAWQLAGITVNGVAYNQLGTVLSIGAPPLETVVFVFSGSVQALTLTYVSTDMRQTTVVPTMTVSNWDYECVCTASTELLASFCALPDLADHPINASIHCALTQYADVPSVAASGLSLFHGKLRSEAYLAVVPGILGYVAYRDTTVYVLQPDDWTPVEYDTQLVLVNTSIGAFAVSGQFLMLRNMRVTKFVEHLFGLIGPGTIVSCDGNPFGYAMASNPNECFDTALGRPFPAPDISRGAVVSQRAIAGFGVIAVRNSGAFEFVTLGDCTMDGISSALQTVSGVDTTRFAPVPARPLSKCMHLPSHIGYRNAQYTVEPGTRRLVYRPQHLCVAENLCELYTGVFGSVALFTANPVLSNGTNEATGFQCTNTSITDFVAVVFERHGGTWRSPYTGMELTGMLVPNTTSVVGDNEAMTVANEVSVAMSTVPGITNIHLYNIASGTPFAITFTGPAPTKIIALRTSGGQTAVVLPTYRYSATEWMVIVQVDALDEYGELELGVFGTSVDAVKVYDITCTVDSFFCDNVVVISSTGIISHSSYFTNTVNIQDTTQTIVVAAAGTQFAIAWDTTEATVPLSYTYLRQVMAASSPDSTVYKSCGNMLPLYHPATSERLIYDYLFDVDFNLLSMRSVDTGCSMGKAMPYDTQSTPGKLSVQVKPQNSSVFLSIPGAPKGIFEEYAYIAMPVLYNYTGAIITTTTGGLVYATLSQQNVTHCACEWYVPLADQFASEFHSLITICERNTFSTAVISLENSHSWLLGSVNQTGTVLPDGTVVPDDAPLYGPCDQIISLEPGAVPEDPDAFIWVLTHEPYTDCDAFLYMAGCGTGIGCYYYDYPAVMCFLNDTYVSRKCVELNSTRTYNNVFATDTVLVVSSSPLAVMTMAQPVLVYNLNSSNDVLTYQDAIVLGTDEGFISIDTDGTINSNTSSVYVVVGIDTSTMQRVAITGAGTAVLDSTQSTMCTPSYQGLATIGTPPSSAEMLNAMRGIAQDTTTTELLAAARLALGIATPNTMTNATMTPRTIATEPYAIQYGVNYTSTTSRECPGAHGNTARTRQSPFGSLLVDTGDDICVGPINGTSLGAVYGAEGLYSLEFVSLFAPTPGAIPPTGVSLVSAPAQLETLLMDYPGSLLWPGVIHETVWAAAVLPNASSCSLEDFARRVLACNGWDFALNETDTTATMWNTNRGLRAFYCLAYLAYGDTYTAQLYDTTWCTGVTETAALLAAFGPATLYTASSDPTCASGTRCYPYDNPAHAPRTVSGKYAVPAGMLWLMRNYMGVFVPNSADLPATASEIEFDMPVLHEDEGMCLSTGEPQPVRVEVNPDQRLSIVGASHFNNVVLVVIE